QPHGLKPVVQCGEVGRVLARLDLRPAEADRGSLEHDGSARSGHGCASCENDGDERDAGPLIGPRRLRYTRRRPPRGWAILGVLNGSAGAEVAELADPHDSQSCTPERVWVRFPPSAPFVAKCAMP